MAKPLEKLNSFQSQLIHMRILDLSIIEIINQVIYGVFYPNMVLLDQYHFYSGNGSN